MLIKATHKHYCCLFFFLLLCTTVQAQQARSMLQKGWASLAADNDTDALRYFGHALILARQEQNTADKAQALLYLGITWYGVSYTRGLDYCMQAMDEYRKLEKTDPVKAFEGRSKCLQLISTIKSRQGHYREAITVSTEAMKGFSPGKDTTGYLGLIYNSLGSAYHQLHIDDSSAYYHRMALAEHLRSRNFTYLPTAYIQVAALETAAGHQEDAWKLYVRGLQIADSTANRQAQVSVLLGMGDWHLAGNNIAEAGNLYHKAGAIAATLSDRSFRVKTTERFLKLHKEQGHYREAMAYQDTLTQLKNDLYSWDREKEIKNLEIQYDVAEKERLLQLAQKEKKVVLLTNSLLWVSIGALLFLSTGIILSLRRTNKRDKLLLQTQKALVAATEEQKRLTEVQKQEKEQQMQRDLEYRESQLSAMTLQMLQKSELLQELQQRLEEDNYLHKDQQLVKIISKGMVQDKEWVDFNTHFEQINQHFYTRLKQAYPTISGNDLKICALIKLRLSIKEMAAILNISPDSVKTARYRLRKKLQLNTEDNLTDFIMSL